MWLVSIGITAKEVSNTFRTEDYCGAGCQIKWGYCQETEGKPSTDGTCGGSAEFTCKGSGFGDCCSEFNFCGKSTDHCGDGCQADYGVCSSNATGSSSTSSAVTSTATSATSVVKRHDVTTTSFNPAASTYVPCPAANNTVFTTDCGAEFKIECGIDRAGGDEQWPGNGAPTYTLQDCINVCIGRPGCINVNWHEGSPGNCYVKVDLNPPLFDRPWYVTSQRMNICA